MILNFPALDLLIGKIKEREFQKPFFHSLPYFDTYPDYDHLKLSVEYAFASVLMPKFHGQMQNISVSERTPKVTFKCALTNGFYGRLGRNKVSNFLNTYT